MRFSEIIMIIRGARGFEFVTDRIIQHYLLHNKVPRMENPVHILIVI